MSDDLRERIERVLYAEAIRWAAACTTGDGPYPLAERQADAVLAVLRDTPTVCRTCGSDDRGVFLSRCVGVVHAWHSEGNR